MFYAWDFTVVALNNVSASSGRHAILNLQKSSNCIYTEHWTELINRYGAMYNIREGFERFTARKPSD